MAKTKKKQNRNKRGGLRTSRDWSLRLGDKTQRLRDKIHQTRKVHSVVPQQIKEANDLLKNKSVNFKKSINDLKNGLLISLKAQKSDNIADIKTAWANLTDDDFANFLVPQDLTNDINVIIEQYNKMLTVAKTEDAPPGPENTAIDAKTRQVMYVSDSYTGATKDGHPVYKLPMPNRLEASALCKVQEDKVTDKVGAAVSKIIIMILKQYANLINKIGEESLQFLTDSRELRLRPVNNPGLITAFIGTTRKHFIEKFQKETPGLLLIEFNRAKPSIIDFGNDLLMCIENGETDQSCVTKLIGMFNRVSNIIDTVLEGYAEFKSQVKQQAVSAEEVRFDAKKKGRYVDMAFQLASSQKGIPTETKTEAGKYESAKNKVSDWLWPSFNVRLGRDGKVDSATFKERIWTRLCRFRLSTEKEVELANATSGTNPKTGQPYKKGDMYIFEMAFNAWSGIKKFLRTADMKALFLQAARSSNNPAVKSLAEEAERNKAPISTSSLDSLENEQLFGTSTQRRIAMKWYAEKLLLLKTIIKAYLENKITLDQETLIKYVYAQIFEMVHYCNKLFGDPPAIHADANIKKGHAFGRDNLIKDLMRVLNISGTTYVTAEKMYLYVVHEHTAPVEGGDVNETDATIANKIISTVSLGKTAVSAGADKAVNSYNCARISKSFVTSFIEKTNIKEEYIPIFKELGRIPLDSENGGLTFDVLPGIFKGEGEDGALKGLQVKSNNMRDLKLADAEKTKLLAEEATNNADRIAAQNASIYKSGAMRTPEGMASPHGAVHAAASPRGRISPMPKGTPMPAGLERDAEVMGMGHRERARSSEAVVMSPRVAPSSELVSASIGGGKKKSRNRRRRRRNSQTKRGKRSRNRNRNRNRNSPPASIDPGVHGSDGDQSAE